MGVRLYEYEGRQVPMAVLYAARVDKNVTSNMIRCRINRGWSVERAISEPALTPAQAARKYGRATAHAWGRSFKLPGSR